MQESESERKSIIEVGDKIQNTSGQWAEVTEVIQGKYGLLVKGKLSYQDYAGYYPIELPLVEDIIWDWYGWASLSVETLENGHKVCGVSFWNGDPRHGIEEYDLEWELTLEAMKENNDSITGCVRATTNRGLGQSVLPSLPNVLKL